MGGAKGDLGAYIVAHLDEALDRGWISVFYQPVVRTVSGKLCGMEALARWNDPTHGLFGPETFVRPLERAGIIHRLDAFVVRQICRQLQRNIESGKPFVPVSFNLSRLDFDLCNMFGIVEQAARENGVPRDLLNIEIAESVFGGSPASMARIIGDFHRMGYQVWMDDFGCAYSSLNMLKDFQFDALKIDMEFLSRFGARSRIIIASVVDMAKRLGIQTLAEGVETHEHAEFLRRIGCEKQQGFYYGRPEPYSDELMVRIECDLGIEHPGERQYYRAIGSVNTLSLSERDFVADSTANDYATSMPLAFVEFDGQLFRIVDCNESFASALGEIGLEGVEKVEELMNDLKFTPAVSIRRSIEAIREEGFARHQYMVSSGRSCVMRAKHVASHGKRTMMLVTIEGVTVMHEQARQERMSTVFEALYGIYDHVDVIHLDKGFAEPLYSRVSFKRLYDIPVLSDAVRQFAENEIFEADRKRYLVFMDVSTLSQRVDESGRGFISGLFRTHDRGGNYAWKLFVLIRLSGDGDQVMLCIRDTDQGSSLAIKALYEQDGGWLSDPAEDGRELGMTEDVLWRTMLGNPRYGVFWKDVDRRFVGCNQKFLDIFGFGSVGEVRGKTEEEMGWHIDALPVIREERRVLDEGVRVEGALAQCIVGGRPHDMLVSKQPVYRNGRIIGLMGYFADAEEMRASDGFLESVTYVDAVTGVLNRSGVDVVATRFVEAYERTGANFAVALVNLDSYKSISENFGYDFADQVLGVVADVVREKAGPNCVIGHTFAPRFVVLKQHARVGEAEAIAADVVAALHEITEVDGVRCTLYARGSAARYTEADGLDSLKRLVRYRLRKSS